MQADLGKNHFELFGLPVAYDVNRGDLDSRYRELQRRIHPDRFANASSQERRFSMQMAARINDAFQTLKDPLRRARYLLGLQGVETDEETDTAMDPAFLMEQMEFRESLEEARQQGSASRFFELAGEIEKRLHVRKQELVDTFAENTEVGLEQARRLVREMQFFAKLLKEVESLEEELVPAAPG